MSQEASRAPEDTYLPTSYEASCVVVFALRSLHATLLQSSNLFEGSLTIGGSIPSRLQSFLNFSINSSKELTLLEQRTLAQLLLVVLVVVDLLELQYYWTVICLCSGAYRKPIFLVLHLKIKLFPMFSVTIDLVGKYRTQATA